jgi:hypothetical protein
VVSGNPDIKPMSFRKEAGLTQMPLANAGCQITMGLKMTRQSHLGTRKIMQ